MDACYRLAVDQPYQEKEMFIYFQNANSFYHKHILNFNRYVSATTEMIICFSP